MQHLSSPHLHAEAGQARRAPASIPSHSGAPRLAPTTAPTTAPNYAPSCAGERPSCLASLSKFFLCQDLKINPEHVSLGEHQHCAATVGTGEHPCLVVFSAPADTIARGCCGSTLTLWSPKVVPISRYTQLRMFPSPAHEGSQSFPEEHWAWQACSQPKASFATQLHFPGLTRFSAGSQRQAGNGDVARLCPNTRPLVPPSPEAGLLHISLYPGACGFQRGSPSATLHGIWGQSQTRLCWRGNDPSCPESSAHSRLSADVCVACLGLLSSCSCGGTRQTQKSHGRLPRWGEMTPKSWNDLKGGGIKNAEDWTLGLRRELQALIAF